MQNVNMKNEERFCRFLRVSEYNIRLPAMPFIAISCCMKTKSATLKKRRWF